VSSALFSPNGKRILTLTTSTSADSTARLWDSETGRPIGEPLKVVGRGSIAAAFSPDSKRFLTTTSAAARLWDGEMGKPIGEPLDGHEDWISTVTFSADGKRANGW
jgi:WD40 repeat protein